jgi:heme/copper-type cytochrome/quinol oxidase subunit 3
MSNSYDDPKQSMAASSDEYYVPAASGWPILGAVALFLIALGAGATVGDLLAGQGPWILLTGVGLILLMLTGWFRDVITESMGGLYSTQMDRSFRQGMSWFIFSEVMFFGAFFGALFYIRMIAVPWLGGAYIHAYHELNLRLESGVYGNTFFMLTGFHGVHVTLGAILLFIVWCRVLKGHFTPQHHFAFQAGAWYWHFVDVVWLCLFVFVYIL